MSIDHSDLSRLNYPCFLKFAPNEQSTKSETKNSLAILSRIDGSKSSAISKKSRRDPTTTEDGVLNVRKAVRHASGGRGAAALGRDLERKKGAGRKGKK